MPAFSITPAGPFPPSSEGDFPDFIQFRNEGVNLGDSAADTVDFVGAGVTATRGTGANSDVVTVNISGAGGGSETETLVVSLVGTADGAFDDADFSNWTGTVIKTSTDATWDETNNRITLATAGVYEVSIQGRVASPAGAWPTSNGSWSLFGGRVSEAAGITQSAYFRQASGAQDDNIAVSMAWFDRFMVNNSAGSVPTVTPKVYANRYLGSGEPASFSAVVTVKRVP